MSDLNGVILSEYLLIQCLHKGGVADVYRARQVDEDATGGDQTKNDAYDVAVKVFRSGYAQRAAFREHFMTEAEKIGQFEHLNIVPFLEYGEGDDLLYFVMPYMMDGTLGDFLARMGGQLTPVQALPILEQLCNAIQYAHDRDILHGNIKPTNIFVTADRRVLLSDFGIAHGYDDSQQSLTRVGWGSAEYAAPEQSLGVTRRTSDVYSLGIVLFFMLTGAPPFTGQTPVEVLLKHVRQEPPSARSLVSTISESVDEVLQKAIRKRLDDRYATMREFFDAFATAVKTAPISPQMRTISTVKLKPFYTTTKTNVVTPSISLPVSRPDTSESSSSPFVAISAPETPIPSAKPRTREVSGTQLPPLFKESSPVLYPHTRDTRKLEEMKTLSQDFLASPDESNDALFWSVDPSEWSPIAKVEKNDESDVPCTADDYLQSKPLMLPTSEEVKHEKRSATFQSRLKKLLPLIVVLLLLLGLLGAILSAFFYPTSTSKPDSYHGPRFRSSYMIVVSVSQSDLFSRAS